MKTFDEIYDELQGRENNELNDLWKEAKKEKEKANKIFKNICVPIDIVAVIIVLYLAKSLFAMLFIVIPMLIINLFVYIIINIVVGGKETIKYYQKYKDVVIKKLINNFYDNLEYFPNKGMPENIYRNLRYECYNRYRSDDYLEALINNKNSIQMAEILTQEEETYRDSDGHTRTRTITQFHGLFAKIQLDKSINTELKIAQNGSAFFRGNQLKMDSSEFEKYFDVEATNQIIGMQLLTADVMEDLIEFYNKTNIKYEIGIDNNVLYLRFHSGNMFEPGNLKNGPLEKNIIQKYFYMLDFTYNLSNMLINLVNETEI